MPHALIIVTGCLATLVWRIFGVSVAQRIDTNHWLYDWFSHVSYAAVAAILVQNLFGSDDRLSIEEVITRFAALICGLLVCRMRADRVFLGLIVALATYMVLDYTQLIALLWAW